MIANYYWIYWNLFQFQCLVIQPTEIFACLDLIFNVVNRWCHDDFSPCCYGGEKEAEMAADWVKKEDKDWVAIDVCRFVKFIPLFLFFCTKTKHQEAELIIDT